MNKRMRVLFSGTVQGVGFRFTARGIAARFPVKGFVRNLPDGKVELVAEGEEPVLKNFLKAVCESSMSGYIRSAEAEWSAPQDEFQNFTILA